MSEEGEIREDFEEDGVAGDDITSKGFTFATPSFVSSPEKVISFGVNSEHVFSKRHEHENAFTFAAPESISQINEEHSSMIIEDYDKPSDKPYKPKISRKVYNPPANLFASALRQTEGREKLMQDFNQLKKNSRTRNTVKEDIRNSITCTNVPKRLLTKTMAMEHFSKFGRILKMTLRPRKETITIYYASKDSANAAYYKTGQFMGEKFNVHWTTSETSPKSPTKKKESGKDAVRDFITADEDEVNAELEAMMGLEYNLHGSNKSGILVGAAKPKTKKTKEVPKYEKPVPKIVKLEKMETESQVQAIVPKASSEELQNIIRQAAHTSEDKYKILEARDRFMRLKQIKPNTLAAAKVTIGTCPDMCPEKERLMRESQRQVALYEQAEGKEYRINHAKAVKQYSRSSADQEEPLAHELRPASSLKMTMSYLLHEIMDMCMIEGTNLGEWFHFLWDRTRGIRKDITQQELCCVESVELVEQCARFHIVCSERLCSEEPSVFDKKINTENLTKCLQTLKYMYHDLRVEGVACKNEAEFRGYIILLNLNDGNFMWDLQKLPANIQKSSEVRFAIEVHCSIASHNFSKFFKLVRRTSYLNACILLRYFNQVRVTALSVMVKAYCRTTTPFPLYELVDILGFEDENEAVYFCEQVGLGISKDELYIIFNRQKFSHPSSVEQGRAVNTVESIRTKQGLSVGQCIAGGQMPEKMYQNHVPYDSFDSNGHLRSGALNVEDQTKQYKSKLPLGKNDPYETMEEGTSAFKAPQKAKPQFKSIGDQTDAGIRKSSQTFLAEPSIKPATGFGDVFNKGSKPAPLFPAVFNQNAFHKEQSPFAKSASIITKLGTDQNLPFGNKLSQFEAKQSKPFSESGDKSDSKFLQRQNPGLISKPNKSVVQKAIGDNAAVLQPGADVPKFKDSSPFAMATNKTIFSGITQGNIFAKPASGTSIFGNQSASSVKKTDAKSEFEQKEKERAEAEATKKKLAEVQRQLEAEKLKLQELEREKKLKMIEQDAKQIIEELEDEVTREICISVVKEEVDRIRMYNAVSKNITESLLNDVVQQLCEELLKDEIHVQEQLHKISERIKQRLVKKYYKSWRQNVTKKRRQREALDDTPVWLQNRTVSECARLLYHPQQDLVIQNMRKRFKSNPVPAVQDNLAPVEVIVYAGMKENLKSSDNEMIPNIFWKLVISWPDLENRILLWQHKKIMNTYLSPDNYTEEPIIKTYRPNAYETLNICIRHFEGIINERNLVGTDALLFLAATSENLNAVKRRLSKTILSRSKLMPIPIAIVFLGEDELVAEDVELELDLETLLESGYVSEYTVVFEKEINKNQILRLIQSAALWLTTNKSPLVPLEMDYLNQVLSTCLTQELWLRIQGHSNFNKHLAAGLDDPALIISLHNEAVTHLTDIFLDQESLQYTSFPPELKTLLSNDIGLPCSYEYFDNAWKKEDNRLTLEQVMNSFLLPDWKYQWPIANISDLHDAIRSYSIRALPDLDCETTSCEVISTLFLMSDDAEGPSFMDLLLEIVKRKIDLLDESLRAVYNKNHVKHFRTLPWWFKSSVLLDYISRKESDLQETDEGELRVDFSVEEPNDKRIRLEEDNIGDSLDVESFYKPNESLAAFCKDTQEQIMSIQGKCKKLEADIEIQKSRNKAFNELLEQALMDEDVNLSDLRY